MDTIKVLLPKKFDLVVGDTFQLFYRGIIEAPNPFCYDILAVCEKGKNFPRYFEFLPEEEGEYTLNVSVFGPGKTLLGEGKTVLCVKEPKAPSKPVNILCIGSSTTAGGEWTGEVYRRLSATDGEPCGLGFSGINFIGTCGEGNVHYEGYGGWRWESYYHTTVDSMWVVSNTHNKTTEDQHSMWQDANGNLWQLETLACEYLKFNRYLQHTGERPTAGCLTHYNSATHREPIQIEKSSTEKKSPFYDDETKQVDFASYCKRNGFSGIDVVYIMLGGNGYAEDYVAGLTVEERCKKLVANGKELVNLIHAAYPEAKVHIIGILPPSVTGGTGTSYGAVMPYCDDYGYTRFVLELNMAYEAWTQEPEYRDFMDFVHNSGQFDVENSMPMAEKPVNTRSKKTEMLGINGLHPLPEGYMQVADAVYRNLVHLLREL
ncbi:MAG: SGNH/GDSL hydrolase family protein [Clostridia bacterium]|nr:SGNH/GDSL hydrolase family protein [Clostridia bacterium]